MAHILKTLMKFEENRVSNKNNIKSGIKISIAGENKKVVGIYSNYRYCDTFT